MGCGQLIWQNRNMPRIQTEKLASHRYWRRNQLIAAAAGIALESGGSAITVAAVAERAGLSRTSVYEYFASSSELVADLVLDELDNFAHLLTDAVADCPDSKCVISCWISAALTYICDGRHLLAKSLNAISTPASRAGEISLAHRKLLAPLHQGLTQLGVSDVTRALTFIQAITDAASKRIEAGAAAQEEITYATSFCIKALSN